MEKKEPGGEGGGVPLNSKRVDSPIAGAKQARTSAEINNYTESGMDECGGGNNNCAPASHNDCAWCGAKEGSIPGISRHHQCSRCKMTSYCSKNCQKRHWKEGGHKQSCVAPADRTASAAAQATEKAKTKGAESSCQSATGKASEPKNTRTKKHQKKGKGPRKEIKGSKLALEIARTAWQEMLRRNIAMDGANRKRNEYDENGECAMCLESLSSAKAVKLPCLHVYHVECVGKLREFGVKQVCPLCRADLPPGPEELFDEAVERFEGTRMQKYGQDGIPWNKITDEDLEYAESIVQMLEDSADQGGTQAPSCLAKARTWLEIIHDRLE